MTLDDIQTGYRVVDREGRKYIALRNHSEYFDPGDEDLYFYTEWTCLGGTGYNQDLTRKDGDSGLDICVVYRSPTIGETLNFNAHCYLEWSREEPEKSKKLTISEIEKKLGYKIEIVGEVEC